MSYLVISYNVSYHIYHIIYRIIPYIISYIILYYIHTVSNINFDPCGTSVPTIGEERYNIHLCYSTSVLQHICVTAHLCYSTSVLQHICVTVHLCYSTSVLQHICVTAYVISYVCCVLWWQSVHSQIDQEWQIRVGKGKKRCEFSSFF